MPNKRIESEAERLARYAAKDVTDKMGIKLGALVQFVGAVEPALVRKARAKAGPVDDDPRQKADVILYAPVSAQEITATLKRLRRALKPNGGVWVISAKKNKGDPHLPDQILIPLGLAAGLVDNKICSVSETHSAMRFVIPVKDRPLK